MPAMSCWPGALDGRAPALPGGRPGKKSKIAKGFHPKRGPR